MRQVVQFAPRNYFIVRKYSFASRVEVTIYKRHRVAKLTDEERITRRSTQLAWTNCEHGRRFIFLPESVSSIKGSLPAPYSHSNSFCARALVRAAFAGLLSLIGWHTRDLSATRAGEKNEYLCDISSSALSENSSRSRGNYVNSRVACDACVALEN